MKRSTFYLSISLLILAFPAALFAVTGGSWLESGSGAASSSLGEAVTATVRGAEATYWNPASVGMDGNHAEAMHADWYDGSKAQFIAGTVDAGRLGLGVSILHVGSGNLDLRYRPSETPAGSFEVRQYAIGFSTSFLLPKINTRIGGTVRYLSDTIYIYSGKGWSADLGLLREEFLHPRVDLGVTVRHLGSIGALNEEAYDLPRTITVGFGFRLPEISVFYPRLSLDVVQVTGQDLSIRTGLEVRAHNYFILRAGYESGYAARSFSGGFGLHWKRWEFSYSYHPFGYDLGTIQRFSLGVNF